MKTLKESLQNSQKINEVRRVSNVTGKDLYDGFVNILKKCKSPEELNRYIDSSDKKTNTFYAAEIAYMYLKWITVEYEEYANDVGNEAWEEYEMSIALDGFEDFCTEWDDFLYGEHEDDHDEVCTSMRNVITKVVPKIYYAINHKHITIPKTSPMY